MPQLKTNKEFISTATDLRILAHLALYHATRIHAGLNYALFKQSGDLNALDEAIAFEAKAIQVWRDLIGAAGDVYNFDLAMGLRSAGLAGHWRDELAPLEDGLKLLERERANFKPKSAAHIPVRRISPGHDLTITATVTDSALTNPPLVTFRSGKDQSRRRMVISEGGRAKAVIPANEISGGTIEYRIESNHTSGSTPEDFITVRITDDTKAPDIQHTPVQSAPLDKPIKIIARVNDPAGVQSVRVLYRPVTQYEDYKTLEMKRASADQFGVEIPAEAMNPKFDFMYLIEAVDQLGNGAIYPDLNRQTPYIVVKLER